MNRSRSKKSKAAQLPLFIQKLIEMLQDPSIDPIISWTSTNDSFNIKSISQFTETILPKYFKHNNFSSFIRQLNMYGFRKIRHEDGQNVYQNENFKRGNRTLLKNIKRKINQQKDDKLAIYSQQGPSNYVLSRQIQQMKNKQKDLQQICRHLLMQNQKLIDENNNLMKKMKDQSRKKQRKIEQLLITFMAGAQNKHPSLMNGQDGNMLSIMAGNNSDLVTLNQKTQDTPLQVLTNAFQRNKNMKQFKNLLQNYYNMDNGNTKNGRSTRNRNNFNNQMRFNEKQQLNQSIGNNNQNMYRRNLNNQFHEEQESGFNFGHNPNNHFFDQSNQHHDIIKQPNEDGDGFISINDFINLQDQNNAIIQEPGNMHADDLQLNLQDSHPINPLL